ncbi:MAG: aldo/keto reductase, partial [Verrucomicrobiales bacterium]
MQTRQLGKTDLELSVIGLGTWAIGGGGWAFGWGDQDDDESVETIHEALEQGVNWVDTAPVYGYGHSEEVVGRALKEWGETVIVATKCGRLPNPEGRPIPCIKRDSVIRECEDSLRRLGVETIDLYQMHW